MKKYLMTGVAALAICAAFTSCSKSDELYDQGAIDQGKALSVVETYNQAFLKYIGANNVADIPANQTWGFGGYAAAGTRSNGIDGAINVNGNMWTECPGVRVNEEVDAIFNYVKNGTEWMIANNKPFSTTAPENLNGYFVTQVRSGNNNYADNTYTNIYNNNQEVKNVGSWMNHLQIAFNQNPSMTDLNSANTDNVSGWQHINNFNASSNIDWGASDSKEKGNTKVENKGAFDFAYHNSLDSKYHNKWILVDGADISSDPYYADFYYVCFDFESVPSTNTTYYTYTQGTQSNINGELSGTYYTSDEVAAELAKQGITNRTNITITRWLNGDKMLKGDNVYTDWIVRITKGEREIIVDPDNVCIIAEDLSATTATDFDFNDVVFTVEYTSNTSATITLYAAGGTLPLTVAGVEVHAKFGFPTPDPTTGKYKMINTGAKADENNVPTQSWTVNNIDKSKRGNDIAILVDKGEKNADGQHVPNWIELKATGGEPAAKLCVGTDFATDGKWCEERESIKKKYPTFSAWVLDNPTQIWWK